MVWNTSGNSSRQDHSHRRSKRLDEGSISSSLLHKACGSGSSKGEKGDKEEDHDSLRHRTAAVKISVSIPSRIWDARIRVGEPGRCTSDDVVEMDVYLVRTFSTFKCDSISLYTVLVMSNIYGRTELGSYNSTSQCEDSGSSIENYHRKNLQSFHEDSNNSDDANNNTKSTTEVCIWCGRRRRAFNLSFNQAGRETEYDEREDDLWERAVRIETVCNIYSSLHLPGKHEGQELQS